MSTINLYNPFTRELVFSEPSETYESLVPKIAAARRATRLWGRVSPVERAGLVRKALAYFREHHDEVASEVTTEVGKPIAESGAEIDFMLERAEFMCRFAEDGALSPYDLSRYWSEGFQGRIDFVAKGIVYVITPWNYPLFCAINGVVCALLSGSSVILKHTTAPSVGRHFERAFGLMGQVTEQLTNITVDFECSARIIEEGEIDHVIFTGSVKGGRTIQTSIAKRALSNVQNPFIGCSLELGSSDAAYIAGDADLEASIRSVVGIGRLHNSGQSCCAVKRVFVHETVYDQFLQGATELMRAQRQGDPMDSRTTLGPLFGGPAAVDRLKSIVDDAAGRGAGLVTGGEVKHLGKVPFLTPALLVDVPPGARIMMEETFGPVLPVVRVKDDAQAISGINDSDYGLTSAIFTRSRSRAQRFISAMESGTVYVNRCNFVDARLGWIGQKGSGNGSISLSPLGLQAFSRMRSVNIDPSSLTDD